MPFFYDVKVDLDAYARESATTLRDRFLVGAHSKRPMHAGRVPELIESNEFFWDNYMGKVIQMAQLGPRGRNP